MNKKKNDRSNEWDKRDRVLLVLFQFQGRALSLASLNLSANEINIEKTNKN